MPQPLLTVLIAAACVLGGILIGTLIGISYRKRVAESKIGSAEQEATRLINDAIKNAESKKKELLVEAKEEILKNKTDAEVELKERRDEIKRQEKRIQQKEESLDRKSDQLENKTELLQKKISEVEQQQEKLNENLKLQWMKLEEISGYTVDQAKDFMLRNLENEIAHESALKIKESQQRTKEESEKLAREIVTMSIQRYASDYVAEATVSVVPLPNDEMKGRIIGREGRNIRAIEQATGVDLIIDDTPEAITVSCFEPVRREIARRALEKLIHDGRIHPAKIEETIEKVKKEVDAVIKKAGEDAAFDVGVNNLNHEIIRLLGKLKYRTSYGQNVLQHSIEVAHIAGMLASELGVDVNTAKRAGLLHDIGKALDHEMEGSHVQLGVEVARKYKENENIVHAIEAHHGDVEPRTIIACLIQAADAVSAARPGARRENIEAYIKRLEKLEEIACDFDGVERSFAIQAGREIRILVKPEVVSDDKMVLLARDIAKRVEDELEYPGQIKVHIVRESRAIDYAK